MSRDKPCRTCTDFKTWAERQKKTFESEKETQKTQENGSSVDSTLDTPRRADCPLDKDELGSKTWAFLHTMAAYYPEVPSEEQKRDMNKFFYVFSKFYPCHACAEDLREHLKHSPPETESQKKLSHWLCDVHNGVNKKLGKPEFNCKLVDQRWKDGWLDGSCD